MIFGGIVLVAVPLLLVGWFAIMKASDGLQGLAEKRAADTAQRLADMTEMVLLEELKLVKEMSANPILIEAALQTARTDLASSPEKIKSLEQWLGAAMEKMGRDYEALIAVDSQGKVFADSLGGGLKGISVADRTYFQKAIKGEPNVGDVVKSKNSGQPVTVIASPIYDSSGQILGILGNILKIGFLCEKISGVKIGQTGYPFMVNQAGICIAHPRQELVLDLDFKTIKGMEEITRSMLAGQAGVESYVFEGIPKIAGFAPVPISGWSLGATQNQDEFMGPVRTIRNGLAVIGGLALALAVIVVLFFGRSVSKPIMTAVRGLSEASDQVSATATQVSASAQQLAEGSSEQAAALEETSASMEQMAAMTKANADNSSQADTLMASAREVIGQAGRSMEEMTRSMAKIAEAGGEIGKIVKSIDEIAFQTNLLALNAAVEAARAGEAGMGFAVVADEVRNLAQRAAEAAKNTQSLIEDTIQRIDQGSDLVSRTQTDFLKVAESAEKVAGLVSEIASASTEQAQGIDQVNQAVRQMDQVVQQSAAGAEESAAAAEEMDALAASMKEVVNQLVGLVQGGQGLNGIALAEYQRTPAKLPQAPSRSNGHGRNKQLDQGNRRIGQQKTTNGNGNGQALAYNKYSSRKTRAEEIFPLDGEADFQDF